MFWTAYIALTHGLSFFIQNDFLQRIAKIAVDIPNNVKIMKLGDSQINFPGIDQNQISKINKLTEAISKLTDLRKELCNEVGLNDSDFTFVNERIDQMIGKFRNSLFLWLHELKETNGSPQMTKEEYRKYLTADWITVDAYNFLTKNS